MSIRISDPLPAYCSACHNAPRDVRYIDFEAAHDGGAFVNHETGAYVDGSDDLHICENCLRRAAEALNFKPVMHTNQTREIGRLKLAAEHWREYAQNLERTLQERPEAPSGTRAAQRKVAA